jgi:diadenosine tetraphosphate (Ap4A) HIT family hydrolase
MGRSPGEWRLHPELARDCAFVADLALCRVLVLTDANYPWLVLVPREPALVDVIDIDEKGRAQLMREACAAAAALKAITRCDKLNVAALGNVVAQLHVHVIARFHHDPAWPKPVWGQVPARSYDAAALATFIESVRTALASKTIREA